MNLKMFGIAVFLSLSAFALNSRAQSQDYNQGTKEELNQEIDQLYPKRAKKSPAPDQVQAQSVNDEEVKPATRNTGGVQIQEGTAASQPIYILQQPTAVPQAAQAQPTTTVEAPAVKEPRSEVLRKQREEVERQTEDKLTERLENDRLQSEKDRADRIFNPAPSPAPAPVPVVVAPAPAPAPTYVPPTPEVVPVTKAKIEEEPAPKKEDESSKFSVGALAGIGSYPTLSNVNGAYAAGVVGELEFPERFGIELAALFSNYNLTNVNPYASSSYIVNVDQTNVTAGANYHILEGRVSPVVGVLAGYTRRNFSDRVTYGPANPNSGSSAFDGGFMAGVDIRATKSLTVGADIRYMMNISYRTDNALAYNNTIGNPYSYVPASPLEASNYYFATINLKLAL